MKIEHEMPTIPEYSVNDKSVKNIMTELAADENEGVRNYLAKISELIESLESKKINALINFLLYGMLVNDGLSLDCISYIREDLEEYIDCYHDALDAVENALLQSKSIEADTFPGFVDYLRTDKDYYKKHKKEMNSFLKILPDIKRNLEDITKKLLGLHISQTVLTCRYSGVI